MSSITISIETAGVGARMESVSSVAIRNIGPQEIDPDDPDQRKLINQLNNMHAISVWSYSDNQPWFLAGLTKANPAMKRLEIESMVKSQSIRESQDQLMNGAVKKQAQPFPVVVTLKKKSVAQNRRVIFKDNTSNKSDEDGRGDVSTADSILNAPKETKMIVKKTLELISDMTKSVQLVYHAVRALARFMTYPTPSLPSDNYVFGHVKGWVWLIYKGLANFQPTCDDETLDKLIKKLHTAMSRLAQEAYICSQDFATFNQSLKKLHESIRKEGKSPKSPGQIWTSTVNGYVKFFDELKSQVNLLVDIREDRAFASDWVFDPCPSQANLQRDFFHFQWIRTKKNWATDEFEVRSDYSTRWHPFSDLNEELQIDLMVYIVNHFTAVLEECKNFVNCNVHLSFDLEEIRCLKFAIDEISAVKDNKQTTALVEDRARRLFEDMALLEEISQEFMNELDWIVDIMDPCYDTIRKWLKKENFEPLKFDGSHRSRNNLCCGCYIKSHENFLDLYGTPMTAVLLRTPINEEMVRKFFPAEHLVDQNITRIRSSAPINSYGVSEGYFSSLFDRAIGRDPPVATPKTLPKVRRKSRAPDQDFKIHKFKGSIDAVIRPGDNKIDTETYLNIIDQVKKFLQAVGSGLSSIVSEITERFERLENLLYTELSDYYESLENIVDHEVAAGIIVKDPLTCGTRAFRRLHAVFLFVILFLDALSQLADFEPTSYTCKTAYNKSLSKYHSWFVQKTQTYAMYSIPTKVLLYEKLFPEMSVAEVDAIFKELVPQAMLVYDHCQSIFDRKEIPDL